MDTKDIDKQVIITCVAALALHGMLCSDAGNHDRGKAVTKNWIKKAFEFGDAFAEELNKREKA